LADLNLPDSRGLETLQSLRKHTHDLPVLVLTGMHEEEVGVEAVKSGAQDYLVKGEVNTALLTRAIRYAIERQRSEVSLRASEERYRELFENANDAVYTIDLDGNFTSVNNAAVRLSGYSPEELLQMNLLQLMSGDDARRSSEMRDRKLRGEQPETRYTVEMVMKGGARRTVEVSSRLIYEGGRPVGVQGIARDVTDARALEQRLRQSQKMEAIGRTAGGVAHEFNNLLTIITGHTELVLESLEGDSTEREQLIEIGRAAERAARITRELLTISRHRVASTRAVDLNELVTRMAVLVRPLLGDEVVFQTRLAPSPLIVNIDPALFEQVILNLAFNARDAMPGGGHLTLQTARTTLARGGAGRQVRPGEYAQLAVIDTGVGMDAETMSRIFEPFFTTKEVGKGTGLGLAVVFGVVTQSGGQIEVESKPGQGSTFTVHLPLVSEPRLYRHSQVVTANAGGGSEIVLVVDDDESVRRVLRRVLTSRGYRVIEAESGREAMEKAHSLSVPVDLVITDVVMPEMRGTELATRLREQWPELRVLYISGYSEDMAAEGRREQYLQKPFTPDALAAKVREALTGRSLAQQGK
jgi:PAS domain S-box-containing protein